MRDQLIHTPLAIDGVTAADLEMLLDLLGIHVLADTIMQYWGADARVEVFRYASAQIAARRCPGLLSPPIPEVLQPFYDASLVVEA